MPSVISYKADSTGKVTVTTKIEVPSLQVLAGILRRTAHSNDWFLTDEFIAWSTRYREFMARTFRNMPERAWFKLACDIAEGRRST